MENQVLVELSRVLKQIQLCKLHSSPSSDWVMVVQPACSSNLSDDCFRSYYENIQSFAEMIGDLIVLIAHENQFVRHLAGNVLVSIFEFAAVFGSAWDKLIQSLCIVLKWAIANLSPNHLAPSEITADIVDSDLSGYIAVLKSRLRTINWLTVAGIVRVLRNLMKFLKQEECDQLLKVYLQCISSCLSSPCWDLLIIPVEHRITFQSSGVGAPHLMNIEQNESVNLFLGNILQFFCTLVERSGSEESSDVCQYKNLVLCDINNLVPKVLYWCLGKQGDWNNDCMSQYFRHKILMIMIRLSFCVHEFSKITLWLRLLHDFFQDLLLKPLMQSESRQVEFLGDSPFFLSFSDREAFGMCSHHLQRQTIFLFLKCSISLINLRDGNCECCLGETLNICLKNDLHSNPECCSKKKGLLELYQWLQVHLPNNMFLDYDIFMEKCIGFSQSFIQLFIHEDDTLFEVLLLLHTLPPCTQPWIHSKDECFKEAKEGLYFLVWNLFNPVYLFHLFLSELHYDNLVLLDYLISKDTGISCAEYLLRCLRLICDSWQSFVEFPPLVEVLNQPRHKKSKAFLDSLTLRVESLSPVPGEDHRRCYKSSRKRFKTRGQPFHEAKRCLLLLKESVLNLDRKNLFPYNPAVLLRRLARFEELSHLQEKHNITIVGESI